MNQRKVVLTPERIAEVDEAMWLRAREGDVAAAKVIYARLGEDQSVADGELKQKVPSFTELKAMFLALEQQQEALSHVCAGMDDGGDLGLALS